MFSNHSYKKGGKSVINHVMRLFLSGTAAGLIILSSSCSGSRAYLKFENLKYPASMSKYLYDKDGSIVSPGNGLKISGHFEREETQWSILWTFVPLNSTAWVDEMINEEIRKVNGSGAINIEIGNVACKHIGIPVLGFIPLYPGCQKLSVSGDVVTVQ